MNNKSKAKILLVSTKAGNSGLNLMVASQVVMVDPMFNPYIEMQAIGRAHRIGQKKVVTVHKLYVVKMVEERVRRKGDEKMVLIEQVLQEGRRKERLMEKMTFDEVKEMLLAD